MKGWWTRIRAALGMGLIWGGAGFAAGMLIEIVHNIWPNPVGAAVDIWPAALAYPGFVGGIGFSAVLGVVARHRRFDELSFPWVAAWGAAGGVLTSLIPIAMVGLGLATPNISIWVITASLVAPFAIGGAAAAVGSLWLARRAVSSDPALPRPSS